MKTLHRISLFAIAATLVVAPLAAQDWVGRERLAGSVKDEAGEPVEGATVKVWLGEDESRGPEPMVTGKNGRWAFLGLKYGLWSVRVTKEGKLPSEGQVQVGSATKHLPITLEDIPEEMLVDQRALEAKKQLEEGNALLEAGDPAGARAKYEQALGNLDTEFHADILVSIADTYARQDDAAKRMGTLESARAIDPENPKVLLQIARAHYDGGDVDGAISTLEELVMVQPDNETALRVLADMLAAQGRVEEAQTYLARLPEGTKLDPNALLNVAIDHYNAGDMDQALTGFNKVVEDYPELPLALYYRGLVYLAKGENEMAKADLELFLDQSPDGQQADEAREFLQYLEADA